MAERAVPRLTELIVYVPDQAAATAFYAALLGPPRLHVPGMTEFELGPGVVLGLMPEAGIRRLLGIEPTPRVPRAELYLLVDDPGALHAAAIAAGAQELSPLAPRDWGDEVAYSLAPDGTVLGFARRP